LHSECATSALGQGNGNKETENRLTGRKEKRRKRGEGFRREGRGNKKKGKRKEKIKGRKK
jgi:hypothetical protein